MTNIKQAFETACNAYLKAFCEKHGYDYEDAVQSWIGEVGEITNVGDCFIDLRTIRVDIDLNAPKEEFLKWYDYGLRLHYINPELPSMNFENWIKGCPRHNEEWFTEMERLRKQVEVAEQMLRNAIEEGF